MGKSASKTFSQVASVATFGASDVVSGNKPFAAVAGGGGGGGSAPTASAVDKAAAVAANVPAAPVTPEGQGVAARRNRPVGASKTIFTSPLGYSGVAGTVRKFLLGA